MNENEIHRAQDAHDSKGPDADASQQAVVKEGIQSNPDNGTTGEEESDSNPDPEPVLPSTTWGKIREWWHSPWRTRSSIAEKITVLITLVIAFIGWQQACIYKLQLDEMRAGTVAQTAQVAPIINFHSFVGAYHIDQTRQISFEGSLRNDGKIPASFVLVATELQFRNAPPVRMSMSSRRKVSTPWTHTSFIPTILRAIWARFMSLTLPMTIPRPALQIPECMYGER